MEKNFKIGDVVVLNFTEGGSPLAPRMVVSFVSEKEVCCTWYAESTEEFKTSCFHPLMLSKIL